MIDLIKCFDDTRKMSNEDAYLLERTKETKLNTTIYPEHFLCSFKSYNKKAKIRVEENTTFSAAKKYLQYGKVTVLNFANPENPGGGVQYGAMAQEECLCRSSNLYESISQQELYEEYYGYHRKLGSRFYSDRLIYSKSITVFKTDDDLPREMPRQEWFKTDVITCAAPFVTGELNIYGPFLPEVFKSRIKNIFEVAIENKTDTLILGAFGCGAFGNPPNLVSKAFYDVIVKNNYCSFFENIVFAIKKSPNGNNCNLVAFQEVFT